MIYFAHRGASAQMVQNTLPAFALAREEGATRYELDVHLTQDGFLVVHHDYTLAGTAGTDVRLADVTLSDLKKYPLKNPFDGARVFVPALKDVLPVIEEEMELLNIEFKNDGNCYPGIERHTLQMLNWYSPEVLPKTLFSSFDYDTLARLRDLNKNVRIGLLTRFFDVSQALRLGAESVHLNYTRFTPEIGRVCRENGLKVYLYTVNDPALAQQLEADGADGIFTDRIDLFGKK